MKLIGPEALGKVLRPETRKRLVWEDGLRLLRLGDAGIGEFLMDGMNQEFGPLLDVDANGDRTGFGILSYLSRIDFGIAITKAIHDISQPANPGVESFRRKDPRAFNPKQRIRFHKIGTRLFFRNGAQAFKLQRLVIKEDTFLN